LEPSPPISESSDFEVEDFADDEEVEDDAVEEEEEEEVEADTDAVDFGPLLPFLKDALDEVAEG
jgi:hypothetical protein